MKLLTIVVLFGGIICCSMTRVSQTVDNIHSATSESTLTRYILVGTVTNATVNENGSVEMELTEVGNKPIDVQENLMKKHFLVVSIYMAEHFLIQMHRLH